MPRNYDRENKRQRGGQPGNTNAVKTGFYTRCFRPADIADLETHEFKGLEDEITLLRVFIRRLLEDMDKIESIKDRLAILRALSSASVGITRLLKIDFDVYGGGPTILEQFGRAASEIRAKEEAEWVKNQPEKFYFDEYGELQRKDRPKFLSPNTPWPTPQQSDEDVVYHVDHDREEEEEEEEDESDEK